MSSKGEKIMNRVVYFEIPADDLSAAKEFYSIFGWELSDVPGMDYVSVRTSADNTTGAINGGMIKRSEIFKGPAIAVEVASVDAYLEKVLSKGGKVLLPRFEIPSIGYYAYVTDPEGIVFGLWEPY